MVFNAGRSVDPAKGITGSFIVWGTEVSETANQALSALDGRNHQPTAIDEAVA